MNGSNQANGVICGQAIAAATGVTGTNVHFPIIRPDEQFMMNVFGASNTTLAQAMLGTVRALIKSGGKWMVDIDNAVEGTSDALASVRIVDIPKKGPDGTTNAIGDTWGLVIVQFLTISLASNGSQFRRVLQYI